eukprot:Skav213788  [mRNA]  locus=scaffold1122:64018:67488:- [translate_table: standard]
MLVSRVRRVLALGWLPIVSEHVAVSVFEPGDFEHFENTSKDLLLFVDWDGDSDMDILLGTYRQNSFHILFHERISDHSFRVHELVTLTGLHRKRAISKDWYFYHPDEIEEYPSVFEAYRSTSSTVEGFQVADWDGDGKLDLLLCMQGPTVSNITFLNRALLPANSIENGSLILSTSSVRQDVLCDMQLVDFDEDGVVDLFLGGFTRYFKRQSTHSDLIEQMNPLSIYNGSVLQVFDFDADGHLELLLDLFPPNDGSGLVTFRWLRRALDGSFVESQEDPFAGVQFRNPGWYRTTFEEIHLTDWNSDGLLDIVVVQIEENSDSTSLVEFGPKWYQQVRNRDMMYNSHLTVFEDIRVTIADRISVLDWNLDGFDDHVDISGHSHLYEISDVGAKPGPAKPFNVEFFAEPHGFSYVDWDMDGDLDLLVENDSGRLEYWEEVDGHFRHTEDLDIRLRPPAEILPVDWDQDGDVDLLLVETNRTRYFERLLNGSLHEKQQHPLKGIFTLNALTLPKSIDIPFSKRALFLDCDGDGDLDVLRVDTQDPQPIQACEHDKDAGTLTCGHSFLCLGTNFSNFRSGCGGAFERFGLLTSLDLVNVSHGQLKFVAIHHDKPSPVLWTAGFCTPNHPCNEKGFCRERHQHCACQKGHELQDCSQCERNSHGVFRNVWQVRECKSSPESAGQICHGRGECFDDAQAPRDSTALLVAGSGSCRCYEAVILNLKKHVPQHGRNFTFDLLANESCAIPKTRRELLQRSCKDHRVSRRVFSKGFAQFILRKLLAVNVLDHSFHLLRQDRSYFADFVLSFSSWLTSTALMEMVETPARKGVVLLELKKGMGDVIDATEVRFPLQGVLAQRAALDHIHLRAAASAQNANLEEWQRLQGLQPVTNVPLANTKPISSPASTAQWDLLPQVETVHVRSVLQDPLRKDQARQLVNLALAEPILFRGAAHARSAFLENFPWLAAAAKHAPVEPLQWLKGLRLVNLVRLEQ